MRFCYFYSVIQQESVLNIVKEAKRGRQTLNYNYPESFIFVWPLTSNLTLTYSLGQI